MFQATPQDLSTATGLSVAGVIILVLIILLIVMWVKSKQDSTDKKLSSAEQEADKDFITKLEHEKSLNATVEKMRDEFATKEALKNMECGIVEMRGKLGAIESTINQNSRDVTNWFMQLNQQLQNVLANSNIERRK